MAKDMIEPLFDFKQISKEVFEEGLRRWESLRTKEKAFDLDETWQAFLEAVQASKRNYVSGENSEAAQLFEQAYQDYFYEGGQEAYQKFLKEGTNLRYKQSALDDFIHLYDTQFMEKVHTVPADPTLVELVKNKDYKGLSVHLQEGIKNYLNGDTFKNYLRFLSQFHKYSEKNIRLILAQNEDACHVASFKQWKEMDNPVRKGEKAIYIYAPRQKMKKDAEGNVVKDENGEPVITSYFVLVPVFDVSQTMYPEKLPQPLYALSDQFENPQHFHELYKGLCSLSPIPVVLEEITGEALGYYSPTENKIALQRHQGEVMTLKTLIHEITHACLHANAQARFGDETYRRQEFEAESVAYIIMNHLGIDSGEYSFGYLSSWIEQGNKLEDFQQSLETIARQSESFIQKLEAIMNRSYGLVAPQNAFEKRLQEAKMPPVERHVPQVKEVKETKENVAKDPKTQRPLTPLYNGR
ncbi:ArdC-like ssDNA-binding domain-containing protein [Lactococcus garvieae]|uniref:ArdC-like ssDNA-binding domain-containing protein n=1 Tax=Lactococcus garvieae TaxID=1363 RepID=UPI003D78802F